MTTAEKQNIMVQKELYLKRIFFVLAAASALAAFSCATNKAVQKVPDAGKTEKKETKAAEEPADPRAPQILDMGFSDNIGKASKNAASFKSGGTAVLYMKLRDSEWDLSKVTVIAESKDKKASPITIEFDYQYEEEFVFAEKLDVPVEKGIWTFTATAFDHQGRKSKSRSASITVE